MITRIIVAINILLACGFAVDAAVVQSSPWEHSSDEIGAGAPTVVAGTDPLVYTTSTHTREREIYGYYPRFKPNMVTFDYNNRPYIHVGKEASEVPSDNSFRVQRSEPVAEGYIQTLNDDGQWIAINLEEIVKTVPGNDTYTDFELYTGNFSNVNRVTFDSDNGIYFTSIELPYLNTTAGNHVRRIFGTTVDDLENWKYATIYNGTYVFETPDTFASDFETPSFVQISSSEMKLIPVTRTKSGLVADRDGIVIGSRIAPGPMHSGIVNTAVTLGNYIHIGYLDLDNMVGEDQTAQYYIRYNKFTGEFSAPVFLGSTVGLPSDGVPDTHNGPAITVGYDRSLHAVLGAHGQNPMKYTFSTDNGDTWSQPVEIVQDATYPSLCTTPDGTLHLVYRENNVKNEVYKYRLSYARKVPGSDWEYMGELIEPYRSGYSIYYHKLTTDRIGNLYLSYSYLAMDLSQTEIDEHQAKWPGEEPGQFAHDGCILTSNDNGNSWKLATTEDFASNITYLTAYYSFDSESALASDFSGNANNLQTNYTQLPTYSGNGAVGGAAIFNGTDSGFDVRVQDTNPPLYPNGSFTVSMWVKPDATGNADSSITMPASTQGGFGIHIANGTYRLATYANTIVSINTGVAATDEWTHIAVVFDCNDELVDGQYSGELSFYANGSLILNQPMSYKTNGFRFGLGNRAGGTRFFKGMLDEVAIFKGIISPMKIVSLTNKKADPTNILYPTQLQGDLDRNGIVNDADLIEVVSNWLETQ